jgi:UDP-N-acetylmuramate dehydrogenase
METLVKKLHQAGLTEARLQESMAMHTTWKIGGPADIYVPLRTQHQLKAAVLLLQEHSVPWITIGRGSNTLVTDKGIRGAVLKLEGDFDQLVMDGDVVRVGAGYSFIKLSVMVAKHGLTGLEFAGGIPGTVGGAVYMNAGAHGSDVARVLQKAELLLPNGETTTFSNDEMNFSYRHSALQAEQAIVLSATFALQQGERKRIAADMASFKERRQRTQPWQQPCAGSVFRNPEGDHAARLIEVAGLKGTAVGGAQISPIHANFIVNTGGASARDVLDLIDLVQRTVIDRFGIRMHPEVLVLGER